MATSCTQSDAPFSFEDFQDLLAKPYVNPSFLSQTNIGSDEFYLGPSFNNAEAIERTAAGQLFPCTQGPPFLSLLPLKSIREKGIRTWPKANNNFRRWHARLIKHGPTKALFDRARVSELLEITLYPPIYDSVLFPIALSFWSSEYNTFVFPLGPMSITLRDVGALVNLPPLGDTIFPGILVTGAAPKFDKTITESYSSMQSLYTPSISEPNHAERVAFLHVWLCKYVFCGIYCISNSDSAKVQRPILWYKIGRENMYFTKFILEIK